MTFTPLTPENLPIFEVLATDGKELVIGIVHYAQGEFYTWGEGDRLRVVTHFATVEEALKCVPVQ